MKRNTALAVSTVQLSAFQQVARASSRSTAFLLRAAADAFAALHESARVAEEDARIAETPWLRDLAATATVKLGEEAAGEWLRTPLSGCAQAILDYPLEPATDELDGIRYELALAQQRQPRPTPPTKAEMQAARYEALLAREFLRQGEPPPDISPDAGIELEVGAPLPATDTEDWEAVDAWMFPGQRLAPFKGKVPIDASARPLYCFPCGQLTPNGRRTWSDARGWCCDRCFRGAA